MAVDPVNDLLVACVSFVGAQRRLIDVLAGVENGRDTVGLAMTAELDQLAAAVRQAQQHLVPRRRDDPGA